MRSTTFTLLLTGLLIFPLNNSLQAQTPTVPPKAWTGNFGAGLALTSGNTDTKTYNLSFGIVHDPKTRNVLRFNGLYLRGEKDGASIVDRTTVNIRDEFNLSTRVFVFGQNDYVRDTFKQIIYLESPTAGLGYKLIATDAAQLAIDSALGGVWEKDAGKAVTANGALNSGERLTWKASPTATITENASGLWKLNAFSDALYNVGLGLSASITTNSELKFEVLDSYKTRPPTTGLKKNDVAVVTTFVVKF